MTALAHPAAATDTDGQDDRAADPVSLDEIRTAAEQLRWQVVRTPLIYAPRLSDMLGCEIHLKLENQQFTGSFKDRGSYIKLLSLPEDVKATGVIAMSAGNHAQGVAFHAGRLGIPATIVMPEGTPFTKVAHTERFGARVVLHGEGYDEAAAEAEPGFDLQQTLIDHLVRGTFRDVSIGSSMLETQQ